MVSPVAKALAQSGLTRTAPTPTTTRLIRDQISRISNHSLSHCSIKRFTTHRRGQQWTYCRVIVKATHDSCSLGHLALAFQLFHLRNRRPYITFQCLPSTVAFATSSFISRAPACCRGTKTLRQNSDCFRCLLLCPLLFGRRLCARLWRCRGLTASPVTPGLHFGSTCCTLRFQLLFGSGGWDRCRSRSRSACGAFSTHFLLALVLATFLLSTLGVAREDCHGLHVGGRCLRAGGCPK
mmetsp:Transcript_30780/g.69456  ORF Transcript_30780/g.69456 Transcript_30780/m.69456 type:complete len:238 (-) Transcript_30780:1573-2286(-)